MTSPVPQGTVPPAPREPGERLLRPALLLAGILLLAANMRGALTVVSPLLGEIRADLDLPSSATSALISLPLLCFAIFSPLVPRLSLRWGIERTLGLGLLVLMGGILLRSATWMPGLWIGTALVGAGISTINVLLPSLLKRDFPTRIGSLTGVYNALQSTFAALASGFAVPLSLLPGWSWRTAMGATAALVLIALAVFLPQIRASAQHRLSAAEAETPVEVIEEEAARPKPLWRSAIAWQVTLFMGLQSTVFYSVLTWWPAIETGSGYSAVTAGTHMALLQVASIGGNLLAGTLIRRGHGVVVALVPGPLIAASMLGMLLLPHGALAWSLVFGFATGANIVTALSLFGARTRTHQRAAALSGMAQSFGYLLAAAVPPLLGFMHDASGTWNPVLLTVMVLSLITSTLGGLASRPRTIA